MESIDAMLMFVDREEITGTFLTHDSYYALVVTLLDSFDSNQDKDLFWSYVNTASNILLLYQFSGESENLMKHLVSNLTFKSGNIYLLSKVFFDFTTKILIKTDPELLDKNACLWGAYGMLA